MGEFDWNNIAPAQETGKFDWDNIVPAEGDGVATAMDPSPSGPDGVFSPDRISAAWTQAQGAMKSTFQKIPLGGVSAGQVADTKQFLYDVFQRPLAALTAIAVETPFAEPDTGVWDTIQNGLLNPEKYPNEELVTALMDSGMEPYTAASLATLGQMGYYLGTGRAFGKALSRLEIRSTKSILETLQYRVNDAEAAGQKSLKLPDGLADKFVKSPGQRITADIYLKARGYRLVGDNVKLVDPKLAAQFGAAQAQGVDAVARSVEQGQLRVDRLGKFMDIEKVGVPQEQFADKVPGMKDLRLRAESRKTAGMLDFMKRQVVTKLTNPTQTQQVPMTQAQAEAFYDAVYNGGIGKALYQVVETTGTPVSSSTVKQFVEAALDIDDAVASGQTIPAEVMASYQELGQVLGLTGIVSPAETSALEVKAKEAEVDPITESARKVVAEGKTFEEFVASAVAPKVTEDIKISDWDKKYAVRKSDQISGENLYHETSPESAYSLVTAHQEAAGLNVANDPEMALGQKGKGILIEFDKSKVFGDRGFARIIRKPATGVVGEKEFELAQGTAVSPNYIKSVTVKENVTLDPKLKRYLKRFFTPIDSENGEVYIPNERIADLRTAYDKAKAEAGGKVEVAPEEVEPEVPAVPTDPDKPVTVEEAITALEGVDPRSKGPGLGTLITPAEYVLKQLGLDEYIGSPLRRALQDTRIELAEKIEFLAQTREQHLGKLLTDEQKTAAKEKVWQYLDKGIPEGDTPEIRVARAFRKETEEMLERINETNRFAGLPEVKGIKDYIYHMVSPEIIDTMITTGQIPEGFQKFIRPGVSKELFLKTAQERKGMPEEFLVKDPYEVMRAMYAIDLKYVNLQRALAESAPYLKALEHLAKTEDKWDVSSVKYIENWINYAVKRQKMDVDVRAQASLDWLVETVFNRVPGVKLDKLSYDDITNSLSAALQTGALGLRVKVAIRNALQSSFDWVAYGTAPYLKGTEAYGSEEGMKILKKSRVWRTRMPLEAQDANSLSKFMTAGSALYRMADMRNVGVGLLTRYHYAKDTLKMGDKEAIDFADTDLPRTQWSYTREDLPEIYWSATGRSLATFGSWWMNFYRNFLPELVGKAFTGKAADGREVTSQERMGIVRLIVLMGVAEGVRRASKKLTGTAIDFTGVVAPMPFGQSPQAQILTGAVELAQAVYSGSDQKWKAGWRKMSRASQLAIPYWLGIKETVKLFTDSNVSLADYLLYTKQDKKGSLY